MMEEVVSITLLDEKQTDKFSKYCCAILNKQWVLIIVNCVVLIVVNRGISISNGVCFFIMKKHKYPSTSSLQ